MGIAEAVRQAQLRPECADRYPTLPARMWTLASCLSGLVTSCRGAPSQEVGAEPRILPEDDFEFRGGLPRRMSEWFARTRNGELMQPNRYPQSARPSNGPA
jgi:hypothetical protein